MFKALRKDTNESLFSLDFNKDFLKELFKSGDLICPDCKALLNVRSGTKIQHFYHISHEKCTNMYGEPETIEHQKGKLLIFNYLKKNFPESQVYLEYKIEETNQRSDVILIHENGERWAFEFQCSSIKYDILVERHKLYLSAGVKDFWILNDSIHQYGKTAKNEDLNKHRLCGLEMAIFDNFKALHYLDTNLELIRILKYNFYQLGAILEGKDFICNLQDIQIKNNTLYSDEDKAHEEAAFKMMEEQKKIEEFQKFNYTQILVYRVVDYYYASGTKFKGTISIVNVCKNGALTEVQLIKDIDTNDSTVLHSEFNPLEISSKRNIMIAYDKYITHMKKKSIVDSPMDWEKCDNYFLHDLNMDIKFEIAKRNCDHRYAWWNKESKWFLPKDNKNMKWKP